MHQALREQAIPIFQFSCLQQERMKGEMKYAAACSVPKGCREVPRQPASYMSYNLVLHNLLPMVPNPGNSGVSRHTWGVADWKCHWLTELNVP